MLLPFAFVEAMEDEGAEKVDWRALAASLALLLFVLAGTIAGFLIGANSDLWPGFAALSITSVFASWFLGSE